MDQFVGGLIKRLRKKRKMTLQLLGESTNLSVSYLSLMERGHTSPTVENLHKICRALDITMVDLFERLEDNQNCIKKENRRIIFDEPGSLRYEAISEGVRQITGMCMYVYDNLAHESSPHVADELGVVLQGSMVFTLNGIDYTLKEDDSIYVPAGSLHIFQKNSECPCVSFWASLSVTYSSLRAPNTLRS
ncbi:hypothetical protein AGMMS50276_04280 [Synergistales bacterium]|nr:hypothetical protein AGMMS50276_04280 [Synergistales bacterium]